MRTAMIPGLTLLLAAPLAAQQPSVDDLLAAGRKYVGEYVSKVSGALLDERYTIVDASSGRMDVPIRVSSDLVLLNVNGAGVSLRDTYAINGAKTRDNKPRIPALLAEPTQANVDQVRGFARDSQRHFMAEIVVRMNDPLLALNFMTPADPSKFTYSIEGRKKMDGVDVVGLRFEEKQGDLIKYVLGTRYNAAVSGKFWMEPATGIVHQTELYAESKLESGRVIVTYAMAKDLNMWLPSKTNETYQERAETGGPTGMGAGGVGSSRRLEANSAYANPRHTPISLNIK